MRHQHHISRVPWGCRRYCCRISSRIHCRCSSRAVRSSHVASALVDHIISFVVLEEFDVRVHSQGSLLIRLYFFLFSVFFSTYPFCFRCRWHYAFWCCIDSELTWFDLLELRGWRHRDIKPSWLTAHSKLSVLTRPILLASLMHAHLWNISTSSNDVGWSWVHPGQSSDGGCPRAGILHETSRSNSFVNL